MRKVLHIFRGFNNLQEVSWVPIQVLTRAEYTPVGPSVAKIRDYILKEDGVDNPCATSHMKSLHGRVHDVIHNEQATRRRNSP